jgi:hypothetical protein
LEEFGEGDDLEAGVGSAETVFEATDGGGLPFHRAGRNGGTNEDADGRFLALHGAVQVTDHLYVDVVAALDRDQRLLGRAAVGLEVDQAVDAGVGPLLLATVRNALPLSFKVFSSHKLQI